MKSIQRSVVIALVVVAVCWSPLAAAAPADSVEASFGECISPACLLDSLWAWAVSQIEPADPITTSTEEPDGEQTQTDLPPPEGEVGGGYDPNG